LNPKSPWSLENSSVKKKGILGFFQSFVVVPLLNLFKVNQVLVYFQGYFILTSENQIVA
jgi:hypothetical protein